MFLLVSRFIECSRSYSIAYKLTFTMMIEINMSASTNAKSFEWVLNFHLNVQYALNNHKINGNVSEICSVISS